MRNNTIINKMAKLMLRNRTLLILVYSKQKTEKNDVQDLKSKVQSRIRFH